MTILQMLLIFRLSTAGTAGDSFEPFDLRRVNSEVVAALRQAWQLVDYGKSAKEAGVVVVERSDGAYSARVQFSPDRQMEVQMSLPVGTVALLHTHPNRLGYAPSPQDRKNADSLQIPTFTMTDRGLWVYNPRTRKTSQVMPMRAWLELSNWRKLKDGARPSAQL